MTTSERVAIRPGNKRKKERKKASEADLRQEWIKNFSIMKKNIGC